MVLYSIFLFRALSKASSSVNFSIVSNCFHPHELKRHFPSLINLRLEVVSHRYLVNYTLQNCIGFKGKSIM